MEIWLDLNQKSVAINIESKTSSAVVEFVYEDISRYEFESNEGTLCIKLQINSSITDEERLRKELVLIMNNSKEIEGI